MFGIKKLRERIDQLEQDAYISVPMYYNTGDPVKKYVISHFGISFEYHEHKKIPVQQALDLLGGKKLRIVITPEVKPAEVLTKF